MIREQMRNPIRHVSGGLAHREGLAWILPNLANKQERLLHAFFQYDPTGHARKRVWRGMHRAAPDRAMNPTGHAWKRV